MLSRYRVLKFLCQVVGRLPVSVGYGLARMIADVVFLLSRRKRRAVIENLRRALGDGDEARLRQTAREVFRSLGRNYFDMTRFPWFSAEKLERDLIIHGLRYYHEALASGRGVILVTAHLGNFELIGQFWAAKGNKVTVLVEHMAQKARGRLMTQLRESRGLTMLPVGPAALKRVVRELRSGGLVVVACDRQTTGTGVRVPFLGEEAWLPSGAVELAQMTGAVLVPWFSVREGRRFRLFFEAPISLSGAERNGQMVAEDMEKVFSVVGEYVRRYPGQWVLTEPVWSQRGMRQGDGTS